MRKRNLVLMAVFFVLGCGKDNSPTSDLPQPTSSGEFDKSLGAVPDLNASAYWPKKTVFYYSSKKGGDFDRRTIESFMAYDSFLDANESVSEEFNKTTGLWEVVSGISIARLDYKNRPVEFEEYSMKDGARKIDYVEIVDFGSYQTVRKKYSVENGTRILRYKKIENWTATFNYISGSISNYRSSIIEYRIDRGGIEVPISSLERSLDSNGNLTSETEQILLADSTSLQTTRTSKSEFEGYGRDARLIGQETKTRSSEKTIRREYNENGSRKQDNITIVFPKENGKFITFLGSYAYSRQPGGNRMRTFTVMSPDGKVVQQITRSYFDDSGRLVQTEVDGSLVELSQVSDGKLDSREEDFY